MKSDSADRVVATVCGECHARCSMLAHVRDGKVAGLEIDPAVPGVMKELCYKAEFGLERLYSSYRLQFPQKRAGRRGEDRWQRISWDEAIETIAEKFRDARQNHGAESVALVKGFYDRHADFVSRLGNVFGTPNVVSIDNTCYVPSAVGRLMTYGFDGRADLAGS
ncbi:MAG: molybdopterin-dependent oxidoreductase, partial [Dehalococcoidales bacterium]|nr:molybdopterin-dependent oxidoreductase [Dehalococcoidales bacterium]